MIATQIEHPQGKLVRVERTLLWNDPTLGIEWPVTEPLVSPKDRAGLPLASAETYGD